MRTTPSSGFLNGQMPARQRGAETEVFNHFSIESMGETQALARTTVARGLRILGPPSEGVLVETGHDR